MKRKLFDSTAGMVHYFVRPYDDFVLHSLEMVDYNEYTYRLLREEGYERVLFIVQEISKCVIYAYDKLSHLSYVHAKDFKEVDIKDEESLQAFYQKAEEKRAKNEKGLEGIPMLPGRRNSTREEKVFGKRVVANVGPIDDIFKMFANEIHSALKAENVKTAVIVQMEIFEQALKREHREAEKYSANFSDVIRTLERENKSLKNILVLTCMSAEKIIEVFDDILLRSLHDWFPKSSVGVGTPEQRLQEAVRVLKERNRIAIVDSIEEDEITNLLLRKKIVEKKKWLKDIDVSKLYVVAERLKTHLLQRKECFSSIPYGWMDTFIKRLNVLLDDENVIAELLEIFKTIHSRSVNRRVETKSIYLERVTGEVFQYTNMSQDEMLETAKKAQQKLDELIGLSNVKEMLKSTLEAQLVYRADRGPGNFVFAGNPGTGKTEVARLMGEIFKAQGLLKSGHLVECEKADLVADHVGGSAIKTRAVCEKALDGVLFVDEAYELVNTEPTGAKFKSSFDEEAYTEIMTFMYNNRHRVCVIFAGYKDEMQAFVGANRGMVRRFKMVVDFPDYTEDELFRIFELMARKNNFEIEEDAKDLLRKEIAKRKRANGKDFGNAGEMEKLLEACREEIASRVYETLLSKDSTEEDKNIIKKVDLERLSENGKKSKDNAAFEKLDRMIGLQAVKKKIRTIINRKKYSTTEKEDGPGHYVFVGNPGTGKTEVARLFSEILASIGVLSNGTMVEVDREGLVAGYSGQTAIKTKERCKAALGGVLFVDEAYTLFDGSGESFGKEALDTIMKFMEDNRNNISVIFAGYKKEMKQLMEVNSGFRSRFKNIIVFEDYSANELEQIFELMAEEKKLRLSEAFAEKARKVFEQWVLKKGEDFGNARAVRNFLDDVNENRANRIALCEERGETILPEEINLLLAEDIPDVCLDDRGVSCDTISYQKISLDYFTSLKPAYPEEEYTDTELCAVTESSVLFVKTDTKAGTAFLISPEGYALTCHHVIDGAKEINARLRVPGRIGGSDSWHKCTVINADKAYDMALIKLEGNNFPYLNIASPDRAVNRGEHFMLSGYPFGKRTANDMTTYYGQIGSGDMQEDDNGIPCYNISGEAKRGDSGAPLIAKADGKVIGILVGSMTHSGGNLTEEINYMRAIRHFWELFTE